MNVEINEKDVGGYVMGSAEHLFQAVFKDFKLDVYIDKSWRLPPTDNIKVCINRRLLSELDMPMLLSVVKGTFEGLMAETQTNETEEGDENE